MEEYISTTFAKQLKECRKAKGLSQRELADILNMSFQSISKWENGNGFPNLSLLPDIADALDVSCDMLVGYETKMPTSKYNELYKADKFFWDTVPNSLSFKILKEFPPAEYENLLELGCGEGRDSVFFGINGYNVTGIDIVRSGLDKANKRAALQNTSLNLVCSNIKHFSSKDKYDVICGYRILHYLIPEERRSIIERYKKMTRKGGVNVFTVVVDKPFIPLAPDHENNTYLFKSGELASLYYDWELLYMDEETISCNSSGIAHKHVIDSIIARKII
ncbi:MAG: helix-turn-helix domain-containing protein [Clostridia bacterium]|nr:helix-turn-helix domain-containing protein [Clostridia bacterium]